MFSMMAANHYRKQQAYKVNRDARKKGIEKQTKQKRQNGVFGAKFLKKEGQKKSVQSERHDKKEDAASTSCRSRRVCEKARHESQAED